MASKNYVKTEVIAQVFQVTTRRVQQLTQDGTISTETTTENGRRVKRYDLLPTIMKYIKYLADKAYGREEKKSAAELAEDKLKEDIKYKKNRAEKIGLELKELQGQMHRSEDVEKITTDMVMAVRAQVLALPGMCAVDCADAKTPAEAAGIIKNAVNDILNGLTQYEYDPGKYKKLVQERETWIRNLEAEDEEGEED